MRACAYAIVLLLTPAVTAQQEPPADKPPKKGDHVVARGCLAGPILEASDVKAVDGTGKLARAVTFRLAGNKTLLKQMRKDEDGRVVEVTGVLKSELPQADMRPGKQVGNTRIVVGVGTPQSAPSPGPPPMPVLEMKSYEAVGARCRG